MPFNIYLTLFRNWYSKLIAEAGTTNIFLLLVLMVIVTYPLAFIGFTTNDDATIAINSGYSTNLIETAKYHAVNQGRFSFFWGHPLLRIPYAVDSTAWYVSMKIGAFIFLLGALYYAVNKTFRSGWIALTSLLFFLAFIQNGWNHNGLTSYPFAFNFMAAFFLLSIGLFSSAIERKSLALAGLSGLLYFFALGSELFVLFFPFYVAVFLMRVAQQGSVIKRCMENKKYILSIALPLMAYLVIYSAWRYSYPSNYDGNSLNAFDISATTKVVAAYSLTAFPLKSLYFLGTSPGIQIILSELTSIYFIKSAVAGFIFVRLMTTTSFTAPGTRVLVGGIVVSSIGIFLPNLLLGFTQKHQDWLTAGTYSYLYTYYSFIFVVVFLALILAYINIKSRSWQTGLRLTLILLGLIVVMGLSFAVEVRNQYIAFDQKLSHRKWQLMDAVIKSPYFMEIPKGATVVAPSLSSHYRGIAIVSASYWSKYTKYKTGKNINFVDDQCKGGVSCYALVFRQQPNSDDQYIVLAKITNPDWLTSTDMMIYSMPNKSEPILTGSFMPGELSPRLEINDAPISNLGHGLFSSKLDHGAKYKLVQSVRVSGNVEMHPDQIVLSNYDLVPRMQLFQAELGDEFYGWEKNQVEHKWAWGKKESSLHITNYGHKKALAIVAFEVTSLEEIELDVQVGESVKTFIATPGVYRPVEITLLLQPGVSHIMLHSNRPSIQPGSSDPRFMSYAIRKLQVQPSNSNFKSN